MECPDVSNKRMRGRGGDEGGVGMKAGKQWEEKTEGKLLYSEF